MADIVVRIPEDTIAAAIVKVLHRDGTTLHGNPLANIVADAVKAEAESIATRVRNITQEFVSSDEFGKRIRAVYRESLLSEAARMGRNAARALVNAEEVARG